MISYSTEGVVLLDDDGQVRIAADGYVITICDMDIGVEKVPDLRKWRYYERHTKLCSLKDLALVITRVNKELNITPLHYYYQE